MFRAAKTNRNRYFFYFPFFPVFVSGIIKRESSGNIYGAVQLQ